MKILHVSDIHYREAPETWVLLKEAARQFEGMRPDLILFTGDLSNDGLDEQFLRVKRFVSWLDFCPVLIIPGNRDLTKTIAPVAAERSDLEYFLLTHPEPASVFDEMNVLEDVNHGRPGKFLDHFPATEFFYRAHNVAAVGLNSTPEISARQIEAMTQHFNRGQTGELRIFCAHHSFLPVPTKKLRPGDVVPRSADILQTLIELNVDLLFCGHIHRSHVWELSDGRHRLLCCNAGSLLDTSGKKDNGFLEVEIEDDLRITRHSLFSRRTELLYQRLNFGAALQDRRRVPDTLADANELDGTLSNSPGDGSGRAKGKKAKSKK
jgi:predicted phosphodiesterase